MIIARINMQVKNIKKTMPSKTKSAFLYIKADISNVC